MNEHKYATASRSKYSLRSFNDNPQRNTSKIYNRTKQGSQEIQEETLINNSPRQ